MQHAAPACGHLYLYLYLYLYAWLLLAASAADPQPVCEEITVPLCKGVGYNHTHMPNRFQHGTQDEAGLEAHQFWPLVEIGCSVDLRFFLCSLYTPICLRDYREPLPPCRGVCERARRGCAPLMRQYGFPWPERLRCEMLPEQGHGDTLCMDYTSPTSPSTSSTPSLTSLTAAGPTLTARHKGCAALWIGVWSALCVLSTCATVATFLLEPQRFRYPERPVVFLAGCHLCASLGYIVRLVAGGPGHGAHPALCTALFLLLHFFGTAASLWWVVLSLTWYLAAGLQWGDEAIAAHGRRFHLVAWLLPGTLCAAALALDAVEGEPVAGVCQARVAWVLAPLLLSVCVGVAFLLAGFVSLWRIRRAMRGRGGTDKLERLMLRLGVYAVLYTVPAGTVLACLLYEQQRPRYALLLVRYLMGLLAGVASGAWVWSPKTLESWRAFGARTLGRCKWKSPRASTVSCPECEGKRFTHL